MEPSVTERGLATATPAKKLNAKIVANIEICLVAGLAIAWILFRVRFLFHAGALWRDEVNSVDLSNSPTIADIWRNLQYDSFPMLWHLVLRLWIRSGIGATDFDIRLLGLMAGLGLLAAIALNAWRFRTRPIVVLALLGFSTAVICAGGSIRGYGLGIMLELFTFGLIWDVATRPTALRITLALLVALAAVHMLFYNSVILAAICFGAFVVTAIHRQWKRAATVMAIGIVCAASMTIYSAAIHRADSFRPMLVKEPSPFWLLTKFAEAVSYDAANAPQNSALNLITWELTVLLALCVGAVTLFSKRRPASDSFRRDVVIYHLTVLCAGLVGYTWFLWRLSYVMQPWYYLALMTLLAACADGLIGSFQGDFLRGAVCIGVIAFCGVAARPIWADAGLRKTAIDTDAQELMRQSKEGDLIIISPWYYGTTFQRYFHGTADYVTAPPIPFLSYQNYDRLIPWMQDTHAMDGTIARASETLKSGHAVFLFGEFKFPGDDLSYPILEGPAPHNPFGWNDGKYYMFWERQVVYALASHAAQTTRITMDHAGVSNYERPWLVTMHGWNDTPNTSTRSN